VRRSMAKDPDERYADGEAFAAALRDPSGAASAGAATVVAPVVAGLPDDDEPTRTQVIAPVPAAGPASPSPVPPPPVPPADDRRRGLPGWLPWVLLALALLVAALVLVQALGDDTTPDDADDADRDASHRDADGQSDLMDHLTSRTTTSRTTHAARGRR
jgi:hypothetical protein